eukprot:gene7882-10698_t
MRKLIVSVYIILFSIICNVVSLYSNNKYSHKIKNSHIKYRSLSSRNSKSISKSISLAPTRFTGSSWHSTSSGISRSRQFAATFSINPNFNPYTRSRNSKVRWHESELESLFTFVEEQPLLNAEQEIQYGKALRMWLQVELLREHLQHRLNLNINNDNNSSINHIDSINNEELSKAIGCSSITLDKMSKYAEISKNKLINSNLKLVFSVVSRYRTSSIPNAELIAEGTRGLSKAVLRYDHTKGFRFATYATWYIHQAVAEYVRWRKHPAKMPSRYLLLQRRVKQYSKDHKMLTGSFPSVSQLVESLGETHFDIIKVLSMQTYPSLLCTPFKYSKENSGKESATKRTFEDVLPSNYKAPCAETDSKDLRRDMEMMMKTNLNDVERDILRLRLGLDDGRVKPIKEVGKKFKISWKQVRNVEKSALSKLLVSEEISQFVDSYHSVQ